MNEGRRTNEKINDPGTTFPTRLFVNLEDSDQLLHPCRLVSLHCQPKDALDAWLLTQYPAQVSRLIWACWVHFQSCRKCFAGLAQMEWWHKEITNRNLHTKKKTWILPTTGIYVLLFFSKINLKQYCNDPKYWDRQAWANSVDPDQMPQNAASYQGLHCLPLAQHYLDKSRGSKIHFFQILGQSMARS